ncbi:hypothetical protein cypCar_00000513 [Cyprinus carpio]|nr:hypothetical protein cypCar_00000513 [Cyprinus carpio]
MEETDYSEIFAVEEESDSDTTSTEVGLLKRIVMTTVRVPGIPRETSWVSACPGGLWEVRRRWLGERQRGDLTPMMGSLCKFTISAWNAENSKGAGSDANGTQTENTTGQGSSRQSDCFTLQLHSFTPGQESWQMTPGEKWAWVLSHKQRGGQRFGKGDIWGAADCYCRAVKLAITLNGKTRKKPVDEASKEGVDEEDDDDDDEEASTPCFDKENEQAGADISIPTEEEYKTVKAELHCNLSLCQLKLGQLGKSRDSSIKATELNPKSTKAWYRLGQACLQLGELEESRMAFGKILELQPDSASARTALKQVNSRLKDLDSKLGQRLSKMFN